jgi:hypothetical protein
MGIDTRGSISIKVGSVLIDAEWISIGRGNEMTEETTDKKEMWQERFYKQYPDQVPPLYAIIGACQRDCKTYEEYEAAVLELTKSFEEIVAEAKRSAEEVYNSNRGIRDALLQKLLQMDLDQRRKVVRDDVDSRKDEFKILSPEELANALEIPLDALDTNSDAYDWSRWYHYYYAAIKTREELLEAGYSPIDELLPYLEGVITEQRYDFLSKRFSKKNANEKSLMKLLTDEECKLIAREIAEWAVSNPAEETGDGWIATYGVRCGNGEYLTFEVSLNGDYGAIDGLLTPYDERDGKFMDLRNHPDEYVYHSPNEDDEVQDKKEPMRCQKSEIDPICEGCRHREEHRAETRCHMPCGPFGRRCVGEEPRPAKLTDKPGEGVTIPKAK